MEADLDEICIEAESIVNPFYFNQVSDDCFRCKVIDIIRAVVNRSEMGKIGRFDSSILRTVFFNSSAENACGNPYINWKILATNYDENFRRVSLRSSPLEILLDVLKNPTIVPIVFTDVIVIGLLNACITIMPEVKHGRRHTRTPSLNYIEDFVVRLLFNRPICLSSECLGTFLCANTTRLVRQVTQAGMDREVILSAKGFLVARDICNIIQRTRSKDHVLSMNHFVPISVINDNLMALIRFVDDTLSQPNNGQMHDPCVKCYKCSEMYENKRRKRVHTSSIHELHDENSDYEEDQKRMKSNYRRYPTQTSSGVVSLKSILAASSQNSICETCYAKEQLTNRMTATDSIPTNMSEFRSFLYNLFIESVPRVISYSASNFDRMIRKCLCLVHHYPKSASARLCLVIILSCNDEKGYIRGLNIILGYVQSSLLLKDADQITLAKLVSYLNIYREIICECTAFDEPSLCWMATKPLLDLALRLDAETVPDPLSMLLRCIGWLISKRLATLISVNDPDVALLFRQYSLKLSSRFGNSSFWFDDVMKDEDRKEIFIGLQRAGILSFADDSSQVDFTVRVNMCSNIHPYDVSHSSRGALSRSGLQMDSLFTNQTAIIQKLESPTPQRQNLITSRERDDALFSEPLMDYLNCDLTRYILSYLGYKKLIHTSMVCKLWKDIANENMIWKEHYMRRFKPTFLYDYLPSNISEHERIVFIAKYCQYEKMDWKSLFRDKWLKERSSSKKRIGQQKLRCCTLIGCLTIVQQKKKESLQHQLIHEKDCIKKLQVVKRLIQKRQKQSSI